MKIFKWLKMLENAELKRKKFLLQSCNILCTRIMNKKQNLNAEI